MPPVLAYMSAIVQRGNVGRLRRKMGEYKMRLMQTLFLLLLSAELDARAVIFDEKKPYL